MAHQRSQMDMFHAAPPPPPLHHLGPPPHHTPRTPYQSGPSSAPLQPPPPYNAYQPRQYPPAPSTPQTPHFPSTPVPRDYPLTPQTPQYPPNHQHPHGPTTPLRHAPSTPRSYYPSPSHSYSASDAGPSRLPPSHRFDAPTGSSSVSSHPPQYVYRQPNQPYLPYPHSAPPRIMQNWSEPNSNGAGAVNANPSPTRSSPSANRGMAPPFLDPEVPNVDSLLESQLADCPPRLTLSQLGVFIRNWGPFFGRAGQTVAINVEINFEGADAAGQVFRIMFGQWPADTSMVDLPTQNGMGKRAQLSATAPPLHVTGHKARNDRLPVTLQCVRGAQTVGEEFVGEFHYVKHHVHPPTRVSSVPPLPTDVGLNGNGKRVGEQLEPPGPRSWDGVQNRRFVNGGAGSEQTHAGYGPVYNGGAGAYGEYGAQGEQYHQNDAWTRPQSQPQGSTPFLTQDGQMASVMEPASTVQQPLPNYQGQPSLVRTSQVPMPRGMAWQDRNNAEIIFQNDLLSMMKSWTTEEWAAKRRLVKVWRRQQDSQIYMAFRPVTPEEYPQEKDAVVVSCIFRDDKNSCYITSVDIIYLLEAVIGQRFSIEEKNRIRRNLEGFKPLTVSKSKQGSEAFFKTVMAFPDPKPRNIEKDLKIFPWKVLPGAVRKIISKYTASYSHIVGQPVHGKNASPAMFAHNQLPNFAVVPEPESYQHANAQYAPHGVQPGNDWQQQQPQQPQQLQQQPQLHAQPVAPPQYDPALYREQGQASGLGLGVPGAVSDVVAHSRQPSGVSPQPQHPHLSVDTHAANNTTFYAAPASYSPTPQMTHSSSSNVVEPEINAGPQDAVQSNAAVDPPLYQYNAASASVDSVGNGTDYWNTVGDANPPAAYSMPGGPTYDDGGLYADMLAKPLDDLVSVNPNDLDVRVYTANST